MHVDWNGYGYDMDTTPFYFVQLELDDSFLGRGSLVFGFLVAYVNMGEYAARDER